MNLEIDTRLSYDGKGGHPSSTGESASAVVSPVELVVKQQRRLKDAERHRKTYNNETEEQRKKRRERDALRHKLAYQQKLLRKRQEEGESGKSPNPDVKERGEDSDASDTDFTTSGLYLLQIAAETVESPLGRANSRNSRLSPMRRGGRGTPKGSRVTPKGARSGSARSSLGDASSTTLVPDPLAGLNTAAMLAETTRYDVSDHTAAGLTGPAHTAAATEEEDPLAEIGALDSFFTFDPSISFDRVVEVEEDSPFHADASADAYLAPVPVPLLQLPSSFPGRVAHVPLMPHSAATVTSTAPLPGGVALPTEQFPEHTIAAQAVLSRQPSALPSPLVHTVSGASQTGGLSSPFHSPVHLQDQYTTAFPFPGSTQPEPGPASKVEVPVISEAYLETDIELTIPNDASLGFDEPFGRDASDIELTIPNDASLGFDEPFGRDASFELEAEFSVLNDAAVRLHPHPAPPQQLQQAPP